MLKDAKKIINSLIKYFNQNILIKEYINTYITRFILRFNHIINEKGLNWKITIYLAVKSFIFYKKEKNIFYKDFHFFTEYYLKKKNSKNL